MTVLSRQLFKRIHRAGLGRSLVAALPYGALALGFIFLLERQLVGSAAAFPGRELVYGWCVFELAAIWLVPGIHAVFKYWGPRAESVLVKAVVPLLLAGTLTIGVLWPSVKILGCGYLLLFVFNKCVSFHFSRASRQAREVFMMRIVVGAVAWVVSIVIAGVVLLCIREIFEPSGLQKDGLTRSTLLLSGVFYFMILAALEVIMAAFPQGSTVDPDR